MAYITKKTTVDGIKPIGSNLYGTCSTASGTATKTVSMPDFNVLVEGVTIHVYFENDNTADNATLKVGLTEAKPIKHNGQTGGSWEAGGFISFTYYNGSWIQNDITIAGVTYTFTINDHTMTISGSDGSTQTITLPDNNTTYTLSKSGSTITLTGSDGSTTSVTDDNTTYSGMTQAQGEAGASTTNMVISPKVLHDVVEALDDDTTYSIGISGHTITLTPSEGTPQSVTVPDNNTTYTISKSGNTVTLTGSDGSTQTFTDSDTTYSAGTGLQLSGTTFSVKTGYTTSGNNRKVQADANGNLYVVQKDNNTTYTAGAGLELDGTEFNHSNSVTAVTSASFVKVKYDAQGHITGTTAVAKSDITALGIPGSDTKYGLSISGHTITLVEGGTGVSVTVPDADSMPHKDLDATTLDSTAGNFTFSGNGEPWAGTDWVGFQIGDSRDKFQITRTNGEILFRYNDSGGTNSTNWTDWISLQNKLTAGDNITINGTTISAVDTKYTAGSGLSLSGTTFSAKTGYTTSGNNRKVQTDSNGNLYVVQKDDNTTYTAGDGLQLSGTEFSAKTGYTTSGNNRAVLADSNGNLYVVQKDDNTTYSAGTGLELNGTEFDHSNAVTAVTTEGLRKVKYDAQGHITGSSAVAKADITALGIPSSDTNNRRGFYGTCTTAAATAAKTVTLGSTAGWELVAGTIVGVKFSYTNTASNPTLNVNSSGAKSIIYNTGTITTSNLNKAGYANLITYYMYDGSHWVWMGWSIDDNTWQSNTNARAGYVASGANQLNKVWKTDDDGSPAWRDEREYPIFIATGTNGATTNLSSGVITQIPLTVTGTNLSGNVGSTLVLNSTAHTIAITGEGLYRITASVYIQPTANEMIGAYIKYNTDSASFSGAVEGASSLSYATTTGGAVNITQTIDVPANSTVYVFLCARTFGTTGRAFNSNQATFLEVEQIR